MKYIKESKIAKTRKFPSYSETRSMKGNNATDYSFIYNTPKKDIGKWLNTWFKGVSTDKYDETWTVKRVDKSTASHLYNGIYNSVSISQKTTEIVAIKHLI